MSVIQHILTTFPSQLSKRTDFSRSIISAKVVGMWPDLEVSRIPTFLPSPGIPGKPSCSLPEVPLWTVDLGFGGSWPSCSVKTDSGLVSQALGHSPALPLHVEGLLLGRLPRGFFLPEQNSRWVLYVFLILWPPDAKSPLFGKRPWGLERLKAGEEGDNRGWDGWMALLTKWTWGWASSRRWWRTGKPGVLQSVGSQRVGHNWVTEQWQAPTHVLQKRGLQEFSAVFEQEVSNKSVDCHVLLDSFPGCVSLDKFLSFSNRHTLLIWCLLLNTFYLKFVAQLAALICSVGPFSVWDRYILRTQLPVVFC